MMKLNKVQVYPIIAALPTNDPDFTVTYENSEGIRAVVIPDTVKTYFRNFYEWFLLKPDDDQRTDEEFLRDTWNNYKIMHNDNWKMLFAALFAEYNPIDNYDIHEDFTHTPDGVTDTVTTTLKNDSTDKPTSEHYVATYNSGEKAFEKTTTTGKTTTTQESEIKSTYTDTTHRHGNAGVMTTSEVIKQETILRKTELAAEIVLGGFVNDYLMYFGGSDD